MRIGVDATCWQNDRGYGRQGRGLLRALVPLDRGNRYVFFMDSKENLETVPPEAEVRTVSASAPTAVAASANGYRCPRDLWRMGRAMSGGEFDVLLFPTVYSYVPVFSRAKKVVIIHDVIAEHYAHLTLPSYRARLFWKAKVGLARWQADAIATVSDFSRQAILKQFKIDPERISVVGEASDPIFRSLDHPCLTPRLESMGIPDQGPSVVYVGGFAPHKNLEALVAVFAKLAGQKEFADVRLVMVGKYEKEAFHSYFGTIRDQVASLGMANRVIFTGYLPDEELVLLLNLSMVLVLPSLMEGFGLPAMEAAACGCPVIATSASPLPSLLGEAGIYIDPMKPEELETALIHVLKSEGLRHRMREAGLRAAGMLTWNAAARQMMALMQKVMGT
jgi:glycosyltransferase involved in cell wall biosynthesis